MVLLASLNSEVKIQDAVWDSEETCPFRSNYGAPRIVLENVNHEALFVEVNFIHLLLKCSTLLFHPLN